MPTSGPGTAEGSGSCVVTATPGNLQQPKSTSEVYGDPEQHPQTEEYFGNINPRGPRAYYDESRWFGEMLLETYHREHGLDSQATRIFNTYGPGMQV